MKQEEHIRKLLHNHTMRLRALRERKALLGLSAPPEILIEIDSIESEIRGLQDDLINLNIHNSPKSVVGHVFVDREPIESSPNISSYQVYFSDEALIDIKSLGLTTEKVVDLVEKEFVNHLNYFRYDFQDYPLPVRGNYLVVLDKINKKISFLAVKHASWGELELVSWNSILGLYRRVSRYQYRVDPNYTFSRDAVKKITSDHNEIFIRVIRHIGVFKGVRDFAESPLGTIIALRGLLQLELEEFGIVRSIDDLAEKYQFHFLNTPFEDVKAIFPYILFAMIPHEEVYQILDDVENQVISQETGNTEIVLCLERSLQYIHKMILFIIS